MYQQLLEHFFVVCLGVSHLGPFETVSKSAPESLASPAVSHFSRCHFDRRPVETKQMESAGLRFLHRVVSGVPKQWLAHSLARYLRFASCWASSTCHPLPSLMSNHLSCLTCFRHLGYCCRFRCNRLDNSHRRHSDHHLRRQLSQSCGLFCPWSCRQLQRDLR